MARPILFITRSWHGIGGMQRFSHDLDRELRASYKEYECVRPLIGGIVGLIPFAIVAVCWGVMTGRRNGHIHFGDLSLLPLGVIIRWFSRARITATAHGLDVIYRPSWYQSLLRKSLKSIDRVVCVSNATADEVRKRGVSDDRIVVIPCGVRFDGTVHTAAHPQVLVSVGRLIKRKGITWFLDEVFSDLHARHPELRYVIIGSGLEEEHLPSHQAVTLKKECNDVERDEILATALIFVMPNIHVNGDMEGFGISCIEASARGVPVVASDSDGLVDAVIDGKTGMHFNEQNKTSCINVIEHMLSHPLDRDNVSRTTLETFGWDKIIDLYRTHVFQS